MVETGDNDSAAGPSGEISRYQILPANWQHYAKGQALDPLKTVPIPRPLHIPVSSPPILPSSSPISASGRKAGAE